jgi:hypothetical protein
MCLYRDVQILSATFRKTNQIHFQRYLVSARSVVDNLEREFKKLKMTHDMNRAVPIIFDCYFARHYLLLILVYIDEVSIIGLNESILVSRQFLSKIINFKKETIQRFF